MSDVKYYNKDGTQTTIAVPDGYTGWFEPESAANDKVQPVYPYNNLQQTESGHSFEMDDTPSRERVRLQHRSGTFIEMHPNGDEVHKVYGDGYEITIKNKNVLVEGNCNMVVNGDCNINIKGDKIEQIEGNYELRVMGNYSAIFEKTSVLTSIGDMTLTAGAGLLGTMTINTGDHFYLGGDLSVGGELIADKITSHGRIDAWGGVRAGAQGFVTPTGGISVGWPSPAFAYALPGKIIGGEYWAVPTPPSPGDITMGVPPGTPGLGSMNAMVVNSLIVNAVEVNAIVVNAAKVSSFLGNFLLSDSIIMTDVINTSIYDFHFHYVGGKGGGPTSPPIGPMI